MAILPTDTSMPPGFDTTTNTDNVEIVDSGNGADSKAVIAIEVIFSLLVAVIIIFCFYTGLKKRRRLREEKAEMVEVAVQQQEQRIQTLLQGNSTGTVTTLFQLPPPCYYPPDPATQLSSAAISRLDSLLLESRLCTLPTGGVTLPKYTDLYRANNVPPP